MLPFSIPRPIPTVGSGLVYSSVWTIDWSGSHIIYLSTGAAGCHLLELWVYLPSVGIVGLSTGAAGVAIVGLSTGAAGVPIVGQYTGAAGVAVCWYCGSVYWCCDCGPIYWCCRGCRLLVLWVYLLVQQGLPSVGTVGLSTGAARALVLQGWVYLLVLH